ncbi:MAG: hypothetical protein EOM59_11670 [Clostridia bacterium]|nr:hypothetical protein [Clostridia bacterium]
MFKKCVYFDNECKHPKPIIDKEYNMILCPCSLYKSDKKAILKHLAEYGDLGTVAELAALKAENERLNISDASKEGSSIRYYNEAKELKAENERLKDEMFFILRDEIDKQFGKGISTSELNFMTVQEIKHKIGKTKNYYKLREQRLEAESKLVKITNPNATPYGQENQEGI